MGGGNGGIRIWTGLIILKKIAIFIKIYYDKIKIFFIKNSNEHDKFIPKRTKSQ